MKNTVLFLFLLSLSLAAFQMHADDKDTNLSETASLYKTRKPAFLLITGCARSGTTYISNFLCQSGVDVPHERVGKEGCVSWMMAADTIHAPWGPGSATFAFEHTFHQVRDPLKSISSLAMEPEQAWEFVRANVPEIQIDDSLLTKCAKYWIYWNMMAEQKAEWTYRIEDLSKVVGEMEARLGRSLKRELLNKLSKTTNGRYHDKKQYTWKNLKADLEPKLFAKLQALAKRYGYSIKDPEKPRKTKTAIRNI